MEGSSAGIVRHFAFRIEINDADELAYRLAEFAFLLVEHRPLEMVHCIRRVETDQLARNLQSLVELAELEICGAHQVARLHAVGDSADEVLTAVDHLFVLSRFEIELQQELLRLGAAALGVEHAAGEVYRFLCAPVRAAHQRGAEGRPDCRVHQKRLLHAERGFVEAPDTRNRVRLAHRRGKAAAPTRAGEERPGFGGPGTGHSVISLWLICHTALAPPLQRQLDRLASPARLVDRQNELNRSASFFSRNHRLPAFHD